VSGPEVRLIEWLREPAACDLLSDRFLIEREAGIGGMGIVYRALDQSTGAAVALKVLRRTDASSRRRFANEVEALERLADPTIVRYVAHGMLEEDQPFLAMEWVEGESLAERLARGPLAVTEVVALGMRIASALRAAHALGVIHRDIKPSNVLLPSGDIERAKVADFGLARFLSAPHLTTSGFAFGTPGYASPEQVRGTGDVDARADLFSRGCVMFRCLTNAEAFAGPELLAIIAKLVLEDPPPVQTLRPEVPADLSDLVARMLAKDPAQRPASAADIVAALEDVKRCLASPSSRVSRAPAAPARRRRAAWLVAGVGALALGGAVLSVRARSRASGETELVRAPPPVSAGAAQPVLITDLPTSSTCHSDAILDYREGLQALREATPERAYKAFDRAMQKDPACPQVLLRVLHAGRWVLPVAEQREHLRRALVYRDALSERDRVLLDAFAVTVASDPVDFETSSRIIAEGARRFPNDAELSHLAAAGAFLLVKTAREMEEVVAFSRRAVASDPSYADAWMVLGWTYERLGDVDEEAKSYARCLDASPAAVECITSRITLLRRRGLCEEAEALSRQWIARDPSSDRAYQVLAALVAALDGAPESIEEVQRMRWAHLPRDAFARGEVVRLHDRAKLAAWTGHFQEALALGEELERRTAEDPHIEAHLRGARILVESLLETGRRDEAASFASRFLRRKVAWTNSPLSGDRTETGAAYYEPNLLGLALEEGRISAEAWRAAAGAWEQRAQTTNGVMKMNPIESWTLRWGSAVGSRVDAAEAMQNAPASAAQDIVLPTLIAFQPGLLQAHEGRLRLASGDAVHAAPLLDAAARSCEGLEQPFLNTRAHLWAGLASEKLGKNRDACEHYEVVMHRWGKAIPRSVTAAEAAKRRHALGCVTP